MFRKLWITLALLLGSVSAFAGTCPTGAVYLQESTNTLVTLSTLNITSCKYIAASGLDTATGDDETHPWQHAPHMTSCANNCSSFSMAANVGLIFKGGDTWDFGNTGAANYIGSHQWNQSTAGTAGNPVYIGFDIGWFTGSFWSRPIFDGDNALWVAPAALPSTCPTNDFGSTSGVILGAFNIFENIEVRGVCSGFTGTNANPMFIQAGNSDIIEGLFYHGWTLTQLSTNLYGMASGGTGVIFTHVIFSGLDSPHWATGDTNCTANGNWQCFTGQGIYDRALKIEYSYFGYSANHGVTIDTTDIHDNLIEYEGTAPTTAMTNAQHADAFMVFSGTLQNFYNNVTRHTYATQIMYANVNSGGTLNILNNVWYDTGRYASGSTAPTNCVNLAAQNSSGNNETLNVYGNTFDMDTDDSTGGGCIISIYGTTGGNSNGFTWGGTINAGNNHLIGYASLASLFTTRNSGASYSLVDQGGNVIQTTTANARTQGYSQATLPIGDLATSSASIATIGTGINQTSLCATFGTFFCSGTTGGASFSGTTLTFPSVIANPRPPVAAWDSGALQFLAAPTALSVQQLNGAVFSNGASPR